MKVLSGYLMKMNWEGTRVETGKTARQPGGIVGDGKQ